MVKKTKIVEIAAVVAAPLPDTRDALYARLLPPDGTRRGRFTVADAPGHTSKAEVDDTHLALQGGWWYRGEWTVEPHPDGTLVRHAVYNVATRMRWGVGIANRFFRGFDATTETAVMATLSEVARAVGAPPPSRHTRA